MPADIICAQCRAYLGESPGDSISHGLCSECFAQQLGQMGLSDEEISQKVSEILGPPETRRQEVRGPLADPRIRAIRRDSKVGRGSGSPTDETRTDLELLEELNELGITSPTEAVEHARQIDAIWWEREGGGKGLYGGM